MTIGNLGFLYAADERAAVSNRALAPIGRSAFCAVASGDFGTADPNLKRQTSAEPGLVYSRTRQFCLRPERIEQMPMKATKKPQTQGGNLAELPAALASLTDEIRWVN